MVEPIIINYSIIFYNYSIKYCTSTEHGIQITCQDKFKFNE